MSALLQLKHIRKDFCGLRAVDDVSFEVERGKIVGLVGPNGSGKSTLINLISGMIEPTSGQVIFDGLDITDKPPHLIFEYGLSRGFQEPGLFFQMTALDNTLLPVKNQRGERPSVAPWRRLWQVQEEKNALEAHNALARMEIDAHYDKLASDLSGGQMKLLEMARALMGSPTMMLLDEPTAGVAPKLAQNIFSHINALNKHFGITFLIVEHRLELLFEHVDTVIVMHMGRILAIDTPDAITNNPAVREVYLGD